MGRTVASKQEVPRFESSSQEAFLCGVYMFFLYCSGGASVSPQSKSMQDRPSIQGVSLTSAQDTGIASPQPYKGCAD